LLLTLYTIEPRSGRLLNVAPLTS